jgi:hypothetical protein
MRAAAEAVMACCEFKALGELGDGGIIGVRGVEHKVSDLATCYTEGVDYIANNFSYPLARVGTRELRQRDRQVPDSTVGVSKVSNNSKEAALAAFYCLAVEDYMDLTNS